MKTKLLFLFAFLSGFSTFIAAASQDLKTTVLLSDRDRYSVIDKHNRARCQLEVRAEKMPAVTWNNRLYMVAQNYANKCVFEHNPNRVAEYAALGGQGYVGENIFVIWTSSQGVFLPQAIDAFASEKDNFVYMINCGSSGICGCKPNTVCGHYTQLIWADSKTVACAQSNCEGTPLRGKLIVCDYAPGGNIIGVPPYKSTIATALSGACQMAQRIPLKFVAALSASSENGTEKNVSKVLDDNVQTYWAPIVNDPQPYITIMFQQPLNVHHLTLRWADIDHSAKSVNVQYSTQVDGSNLISLPIQTLPSNVVATINVNQSQIRFIKINFLAKSALNYRVATLNAIDPSFSMKW